MGEAFVYITKDVKSTGATLAGISEMVVALFEQV